MLYEGTKRNERLSLERVVLGIIEQQAYFNGLLEMALKQLRDPRKAEEISRGTVDMQQGLHRVLSFLRVDKRGIANAKPDWIENQIQTALDVLPNREARVELLKRLLEKEEAQVKG